MIIKIQLLYNDLSIILQWSLTTFSTSIFTFIKFTFFLSCGILILLIFGYQIIHVGFSFSEFHFVHSFTSVPMQESFSSEHGCELFSNSFEHFLDSSGVTNESACHFQTFWRNITNG